MRLYLVSRTDGCGYSEYRALIVAAEDDRDVRELVTRGKEKSYDWGGGDIEVCWFPNFRGFQRDGSNLAIREIAAETSEPAGVVMSDYLEG